MKNINNNSYVVYTKSRMENESVGEDQLDEVSDNEDTHNLVENESLENTVSNAEIDQITLSLLMNKNHYRKYVAHNDPEQHYIENQRIADNRQYSNRIIELTRRLLDYPDTQITTDIDEMFVAYTKRLVQYFKRKDTEERGIQVTGCYENDNTDEDVMFGNMDEPTETVNEPSGAHSFWGKERVVKKSGLSIPGYDMRMFSRR